MVRLRQAGEFLLESKFVRTLPVTFECSVREVASAGVGKACQAGANNDLTGVI